MSLSNTGGAGRGDQKGSIIGDVINHGKKQYWGVNGMHYHRGGCTGTLPMHTVDRAGNCGTLVAMKGSKQGHEARIQRRKRSVGNEPNSLVIA